MNKYIEFSRAHITRSGTYTLDDARSDFRRLWLAGVAVPDDMSILDLFHAVAGDDADEWDGVATPDLDNGARVDWVLDGLTSEGADNKPYTVEDARNAIRWHYEQNTPDMLWADNLSACRLQTLVQNCLDEAREDNESDAE
ncbi:MAG: hypothetical protein LLF96_04195 [Eubacteriales bacterium]|nr:hypothetical protein [Eubacteriales bacterium]